MVEKHNFVFNKYLVNKLLFKKFLYHFPNGFRRAVCLLSFYWWFSILILPFFEEIKQKISIHLLIIGCTSIFHAFICLGPLCCSIQISLRVTTQYTGSLITSRASVLLPKTAISSETTHKPPCLRLFYCSAVRF